MIHLPMSSGTKSAPWYHCTAQGWYWFHLCTMHQSKTGFWAHLWCHIPVWHSTSKRESNMWDHLWLAGMNQNWDPDSGAKLHAGQLRLQNRISQLFFTSTHPQSKTKIMISTHLIAIIINLRAIYIIQTRDITIILAGQFIFLLFLGYVGSCKLAHFHDIGPLSLFLAAIVVGLVELEGYHVLFVTVQRRNLVIAMNVLRERWL